MGGGGRFEPHEPSLPSPGEHASERVHGMPIRHGSGQTFPLANASGHTALGARRAWPFRGRSIEDLCRRGKVFCVARPMAVAGRTRFTAITVIIRFIIAWLKVPRNDVFHPGRIAAQRSRPFRLARQERSGPDNREFFSGLRRRRDAKCRFTNGRSQTEQR